MIGRTALFPLLRAVLALAWIGASSASGQEPDAPSERVTLSLKGADLADVLETFAVEYRLSIVAGSDVTGKVTMNLFDVPVEEALRAVLDVNGYTFRRSGPFYVVEPKRPETGAPAPLETEVFRLDYLVAEEALELIQPLLSERGKAVATSKPEEGIQSDPSKAGGMAPAHGEALVVVDERPALERVRRALEELDRRPRQVLIEATILEVKLDDVTTLGVDFNALSGIDFSALGSTSNLNSVVSPPAGPGLIARGFEALGTAGFAADGPTDGLHLGIVRDDVAVFVEALEKVTDATILANPRILAVDRQRAEIIIGAKLGYLTSTTTETATVQEVQFLDTGTQLRFRPFVSDDGYVRLEIHPENSTGVVDPATGLPSETTTEVTTNVIVRDGNTIVIGGLISEQVESSIKQVPFLGSLPIVGALFRRTTDTVSRHEVIVLLTPHIVDGGAPDEDGLALADAMVGSREALFAEHLPLSRQRLADRWIRRGERALDEGRARQAAACAEAALELAPTNVRASRLRLQALLLLGLGEERGEALRALEGLR